MFTGIVEEIGKVIKKNRKGDGIEFTISSSTLISNMEIGDSISVNGVCQTVEKLEADKFIFSTVEETIKKTNLGELSINSFVNLESSLTLSKKISGHLVYGHVDCTGKIVKIINKNVGYQITISYPQKFNKYLIHVGSIALSGISLTIAEYNIKDFTVAVIPHTWHNTILKYAKVGDLLNLEFDVLGKYVEKMTGKGKSELNENMLKNLGF
ncbi:MAG TPA: riboflavin synthase [Melioribacteraceae bacterium]|nr:riboflavin synthase [Melioribacteraceae bacterium]